jgi:hypothetical protein
MSAAVKIITDRFGQISVTSEEFKEGQFPNGTLVLKIHPNGGWVLHKTNNPISAELAENKAKIAYLVEVLGLTAPEVEKMFEEVWAMLQ